MISGYLELAFGPMFSGKTSFLLRKLGLWADKGSDVLYINHSCDVRSTSNASIHASHTILSNKVKSIKTDKLINIDVSSYMIIGIDEAQFFSDLISTVIHWIDKLGKIVYVVSLDGDYKRNIFGDITKLIPHANEVTKLSSLCSDCIREGRNCFADRFSAAIFSNKIEHKSNNQIDIGSDEKYEALCRHHWLIKNN